MTPFDGPDGYALVCRAVAAALRPRAQLWPSEWADQRRILSPKSSAEPARWRNSRNPISTAIMDELDVRHPCWMVVYMKPSQVGATEVGANWVGHTIDEDPAPMIALFPGRAMAKRWMRDRIEPMIALAPTLLEKIPPGRKAGNSNTMLEKHFPDGLLSTRSANIAIDMASTAAAKLLLDEVDRMPKEVGYEGDPVEVILRRMATFGGRKKAFLNSSPTIESLSHIAPWWELSSQGHYYVPCPHCTTMQVLRWDNLTYLEGRPKTAEYMCDSCAALIPEHHKTDMLAAGEWRHDVPDRVNEIVGHHVNCLYTPIGLGDSWAENAAVWERSKRDPGKVKVFTNTRLGETHKDPNEKLDWEVLYGRREPFALRLIVPGCLVLTAGADVQKDRIEVQVIGWSRGERARTVDMRIFEGDPTRDEVWAELDDFLAQPFVSAGGVPMRISCTLIDSGYLQDDVLSFTRPRRGRGIFASKGATSFGRQAIGRPTLVDVKGFRAKTDRRGAEQYQVGVSTLKGTLYERLRADGGTAERPVLAGDRHVQFSDELPEEYFRQLAAEVFDPHKRRWVKVYDRNEALDTFILAMAAAMHHSVIVNRMDELAWQRLEGLYEPKRTAPASTPQPALGEVPIPRRGGGFLPISAKVAGEGFNP